ncbi:MAG: FkbM family methyltransferase [Solirubrobacterales bacterium]
MRTPAGTIELDLHSAHDLLTVNEIFNRVDYPADEEAQVVVDIGANIGVSAAYFATRSATRSATTRVYSYEPSPVNLERLQTNVAPFGDRVTVIPKAVGPKAGKLKFDAEPIGRYGRLLDDTVAHSEHAIEVDVVTLDQALAEVLAQEPQIDVLKIDTEGAEIPTIAAADIELLARVGVIYLEAAPDERIRPDLTQRQRGEICMLTPISGPRKFATEALERPRLDSNRRPFD